MATGLTGWAARGADAVLIVGAVLGVVAMMVGGVLDPSWARPLGFLGFTWWAVVFYLVWGILIIGVFALIVRAVGRARGYASPHLRRWIAIPSAILVVATAVTVGYGLIEAATPKVTEQDVTITRLPAEFDGVRLALVTDLHVGPARGAAYTRKVVDEVNAARPDVIVLGGDLADGTIAHSGPDLEPLRDLKAPLGVYGVSGNHEYYSSDESGAWLDFWETLGVRPLRNERVELQRDGAVIDLAGVYDETAPEPYRPDVDKALAGRDGERALILAAHQPIQANDAQGRGVGLQLSGHTHGGQLWPFNYLVRIQQPVVSGLGRVGDVPVFVSRGAGAWGPPVRVGAPPQIAILTLRR